METNPFSHLPNKNSPFPFSPNLIHRSNSTMEPHPYQTLFFLTISLSILFSISALEFHLPHFFTSPPAIPASQKFSSPPPPPIPNPHLSAYQLHDDESPEKVPWALEKICNSTDYPHLCIATIIPFLKDKTDVISVLDIAMEVGTKATKVALSLAKRLAKRPGTPPYMVSILKECKESYDSALNNYEEAMIALPKRDIGRMNSMLSAVITDIGDCEDEFSGEKSPLLMYGDRVTKMTSNCLAIVSLIHSR